MTTRIFDGLDLQVGFHATGSAEELAQNVRTRLRHFLGEWFLDITAGTPWWPDQEVSILGKGTSLAAKENILKQRIMQAPGFGSMTAFSMDLDRASRQLTVSCDIISSSGVSVQVTESI